MFTNPSKVLKEALCIMLKHITL